MNMKMKLKYLLLLFLVLLIIIYFKNIFVYINNTKINSISIENRIYYNKSLGFNHLDICEKEFLMKFNRKNPDDNSNILITLILLYPNPFYLLKSKFLKYIDIVSREVDFNFSIAIITCNRDISQLLINKSAELNLKYISNFTLNNIAIQNSKYFSFTTHSNNKTIDVFYTNTIYENFSLYFLNRAHYTPVSKFRFSGYYAAGTNYNAFAPSHIGLFDFFDFFLKFDHDLIYRLNNKIPNLEPFPLKKMIRNNQYFFFSCQFRYDERKVTINLYKTFFTFILKQQEKCNYAVLPINLYKYDEALSEVGNVNICWLGFYSMLEIRLFSEEYLSVPFGLYQNRWGDQQFFIPTLYGFNFKDFSYFNNNTYLCSWIR